MQRRGKAIIDSGDTGEESTIDCNDSAAGCGLREKKTAAEAGQPAGSFMYVTAEPHLNLRKSADGTSDIVEKIPFGEKVVVLSMGDTAATVDGKTGYWHRIGWNAHEGFAFSSFLSAMPVSVNKNETAAVSGTEPGYDFGGKLLVAETLPGFEKYPELSSGSWVVTEEVAAAFKTPTEYSFNDEGEVVDANGNYISWEAAFAFGACIKGELRGDGYVHFEHTRMRYSDDKPKEEKLTLFINKKHLSPEVVCREFTAKRFYLSRFCDAVYLQPGKTRVNIKLYRGESLPVSAEYELNGKKWYRAEFDSNTRDGGIGGARCGWIESSYLFDLSAYSPDNRSVDQAVIPEYCNRYPHLLDNDLRARLVKNGFILDASKNTDYPNIYAMGEYDARCDELVDSYQIQEGRESNRFITSDLMLHTMHLVFDRMLQKMETTMLSKSLERYCSAGLAEALKLNDDSAFAKRVKKKSVMIFAVPLALLAPDSPALNSVLYKDDILKEVSAVQNISGSESPISGVKVDYSMFTPRGHYTKSEELKKYFRAMNVLSMNNFTFYQADDNENSLANVATACFITNATRKNRTMNTEWNNINSPIRYLVGEMDDISVPEIAEKSSSYFSSDADFTKPANAMKYFKEQYKNLKTPQIIGEKTGEGTQQKDREAMVKGFRVFGPRFVLDAYMFGKLIYPVTSDDSLWRELPMPEDMMSILGSEAALKITADEKKFVNYEKNRNNCISQIKGFDGKKWQSTLYNQWLYTLKAVFDDRRSDQYFFNTDAWKYKQLETALGSWTELKHDTILYAKQVCAEAGGADFLYAAPYAPPVAKGYVEPQPLVFERIAMICTNAKTFIETSGFKDEEYAAKFMTLASAAELYRTIAEKEVNKQEISDDEYLALHSVEKYFNRVTLLDADMVMNGVIEDSELRMALVADIATNAREKTVRHVAIGKPKKLYVFVNDRSAGPRVCLGYMFDYHSFDTGNMKRYNDEEWKALVYGGGISPEMKPAWARDYDRK